MMAAALIFCEGLSSFLGFCARGEVAPEGDPVAGGGGGVGADILEAGPRALSAIYAQRARSAGAAHGAHVPRRVRMSEILVGLVCKVAVVFCGQ